MSGSVLILAAGTGSRFGSDKRRARTADGTSLLAATITLYQSLQWPIYVVTREREETLRKKVCTELHSTAKASAVHWVSAADASLGMGHSLRAGVQALRSSGTTCALIALADMPYTSPTTLAMLRQTLNDAGHADQIVRPRHNHQPGNPVGFSGTMLEQLLRADGDTGARPFLAKQVDSIIWVDVDDTGVLLDVDWPEDLQDR